MSDEACELLFMHSLSSYSADELRVTYRERKKRENLANSLSTQELAAMGYSPEMIASLLQEVKKNV